jgi:hypothetical protein
MIQFGNFFTQTDLLQHQVLDMTRSTDETDDEVEVTDDDGEEEFDGSAFCLLLAAGKAEC